MKVQTSNNGRFDTEDAFIRLKELVQTFVVHLAYYAS